MKDRYQLQETLGQGGFATTWRALDTQTKALVALKHLRLDRVDSWKTIELFEREAKTLRHLDHPGIPRYIDHFDDTAEGRVDFYLVQSFVEGQDLRRWITSGGMVDVEQLAQALLDVLHYLHTRTPPVIHRDVKPANVMFGTDGRFYLIDFGSVRLTVEGRGNDSTVAGTFGYMAPEQLRGKASAQSDLYGLGATLLFAMTRTEPEKLPIDGLKIDLDAIQEIPHWMRPWLKKMLEPSPKKRFSSAKDAAAALLQAKAGTNTPHTKEPEKKEGPLVTTKDANALSKAEADVIPRVALSDEVLESRKARARQWEGGVAVGGFGLGLGWVFADSWLAVLCVIATLVGIFMTVPAKDAEAEGDLRWQVFYTRRWFLRMLGGFGVLGSLEARLVTGGDGVAEVIGGIGFAVVGIFALISLGQWRTVSRHMHFEKVTGLQLPVLREGATYDVALRPTEYKPRQILHWRAVVADGTVGFRVALGMVMYFLGLIFFLEGRGRAGGAWDTGGGVIWGLCAALLAGSFVWGFRQRRVRFSLNEKGLAFSNMGGDRLSYALRATQVEDDPSKTQVNGRDVVVWGIPAKPTSDNAKDEKIELWRVREVHPVTAKSLREALEAALQGVFNKNIQAPKGQWIKEKT